MKTLILNLAFLVVAGAASAQSFSEVTLSREGAADKLRFIVSEEANIRYYLLEGSRDSLNFDILGRIDSRGNSVLPQSYTTTSYDTSYDYYRIRQMDMSAACQYSICTTAAKPIAQPVIPLPVKPEDLITSSAPCTSMSAVCTGR